MVENWEYYRHALKPKALLHEAPDLEVMDDKNFWKAWGGTRYLLDG